MNQRGQTGSDSRDAAVTPGADSVAMRDLLAALVDSSIDAMITKDLGGRITSWNAAAEKLFGYTADQVLGQSIMRLIPAELQFEEAQILARIGRGESVPPFETVRSRSDGSQVSVSLSISPIRNAQGHVVGAAKVVREITDRKRSEKALDEANALLESLFENAPVGIGVWDRDFRFTRLNAELAAINGLPPEAHLGRKPHELLPKLEDLDTIYSRWREILETGEPWRDVELTGVTPAQPGRKRSWNESFFPVRLGGRNVGIAAIVTETTEQKRAEAALRDSESRHRTLISATSSMTWTCPPSGLHVEPQPEWMAFTGQSDEEMLGDGWTKTVHPDDAAAASTLWQNALARGTPFRSEHRVRRFDGEWRWMRVEAAPVRNDRDEVTAWFGMNVDITERRQTEERLRAAHDTFRHLIDHSPFGIYVVNADFRLVMVSAGAQNVFANVRPLLGRDLDEVLHILWPEPFASDAVRHFRHTLETGEPYHAPGMVEQRADIGQTEAYDWKIARVTLPDGRPGVVCHFYDLSERQRYEETLRIARNRLETALNASQVLLFHQDRELRYTWMHKPGSVDSAQEVIGLRDIDVFERAEDAAQVESIKRRALETGTTQREEVCAVLHGVPRYYDLVVQPDRDANGDIVGVNCAAINVTARKQADAALRAADRQKDEFLAMLAHELRNPLAPIGNAAALLARTLPDDAHVQSLLGMIRRQTSQLTRLVDDLLDVSRIARGRIELQHEVLEIGEIIEQAAEAVQPLLTEKMHKVHVHRPQPKLYVRGDRARLVQTLSNLLNNAAKYTDAGGTINLTVRAVDGSLDIEVRDTGIGIPAELLPHVFDLFVQSERSLDRAQGGLGIGLSVVKRLVEMHGGTVEARSEGAGLGSTFTLRLPPVSAPALAEPAALPRERTPPRRILVVDDNVDAADSLALLLQYEGHEVETVYSAAAALSAIQTREPEIVLLDIGMPQMDGYEVARRIRAGQGMKRLRLVAITGYGQEADRERASAAGFDAHLVKPIDPNALEQLLASPEREPRRRSPR